MVSRSRARPHRRCAGLTTLLSAAVVLLLVPALSTALAPSPSHLNASAAGCAGTPVTHGVSANVFWNGANLCSHSSVSSSLGVDFSQTAHLQYTWTSVGRPAVSVNDARLEMFYFGFALVTRDQISSVPETGHGGFNMSWTPGAITYVLEGVYGLTASLLAPNGTTLWSEDFFVTATAPFALLAVLPIILLAIAILEVYALATSGREEAGRHGPSRPSPAEPAEAAPTTASPPEETGPPGAEPPPPEDAGASPEEAEP